MKVRELKKEFVRKGYLYSQLLKNDNIVIYKVEDEEGDKYFEVFKPLLRVVKDMFATRNLIEEGYTHYMPYPKDESFGDWAWCCRGKLSLERVLKTHFNNISVNIENLT